MARRSRRKPAAEEVVEKKTARYMAGLYVRVSVENVRKRAADTIGTHIQYLRDFASEQPDIEIFDVYNDDDVSGSDYNRPEFSRMMNDVREGKINCIIVKDLSRLGRNALETGEYIEMVFPFFKVRFIAINDRFDSLNQQADISVQLKNYINERYARDVAKKITSAKRTLQSQGKFDGGPAPYGYLIDPQDRHHLIIDEETAPVIREMFDMMEAGYTVRAITLAMDERGYPSPGRLLYERGHVKKESFANCRWNTQTVRRMLQNKVYIGWMVSGKYRSHYGDGGTKECVPVSEDDWKIVKGTHEPIITERQFFAIESSAADKPTGKARKNEYDSMGWRGNIFKGHLRCGECGKAMHLRRKRNGNGTVTEWYICAMHDGYNSSYCPKKGVKREDVDSAVYKLLMLQMRALVDKAALIAELNRTGKGKTHYKSYLRAIGRTRADIAQCMERKAELFADYSDGALTREEYVSLSQQYAQRADELRILLSDQERDARQFAPDYALDGKWGALIDRYKEAGELTAEMIEAFIDTITLFNDGHIEMNMKCRDLIAEIEFMWARRKKDIGCIDGTWHTGSVSAAVG